MRMPPQFALNQTLDFAEPPAEDAGAKLERTTPRPIFRLGRIVRRQAPVIALCLGLGAAAASVEFFFAATRSLPTTALWLGVGLFAAVFATAVREIYREAIDFRLLRKRVSVPVLGAAPSLSARALRQLAPDIRSPLGCLTFQPASPFAAAFRDLQETLPNQTVVSFIAALPNEGATTAALCAAVSAVQQGRLVVVVDCDIRQRGLTKALGFAPSEGVLEACEQVRSWKSYILEEPETGLHCMPAARPRTPWRSLHSAGGLPRLIEALRGEYDLIVLDCPPALVTADGAMIARLADRNVVVAAWDETPLSSLRAALKALQARPRTHTTGIYVNRAPLRGD